VDDDADYSTEASDGDGNSDATAEEPRGDADDPRIKAVLAGVPCVDWTLMNQSADGDGGRSWTATATFLAEREDLDEDVILCECTERFEAGVLKEAMQSRGHQTFALKCRGRDVGDAYDRPRLDMLSVSPRLRLVRPLTEYLMQAGSSVRFPVASFWQNTPDEDALEVAEGAEGRVTPVGDITWDDVLLPSMKRRRIDYHTAWQVLQAKGSCSAASILLADLDHNCTGTTIEHSTKLGRGRMVVLDAAAHRQRFLPTLIQHQTLWNYELWKPLSCLDMCRAHGWPLSPDEIADYGSVIDIKKDISMGRLKHKQLIRMVGDSWALRSQGMLLMWIISNLEFVSNINGNPVKWQRLLASDGVDQDADEDEDLEFDRCSMVTISVESSDDGGIDLPVDPVNSELVVIVS